MEFIPTLIVMALALALGLFLGYTKGAQHNLEILATAKESVELAKLYHAKYTASKLYKDRLRHHEGMPGTEEEKEAFAQALATGFDTTPDKEPAGFNGTPN